jgi:hypothetical protein
MNIFPTFFFFFPFQCCLPYLWRAVSVREGPGPLFQILMGQSMFYISVSLHLLAIMFLSCMTQIINHGDNLAMSLDPVRLLVTF